jgi:hypothetical protein
MVLQTITIHKSLYVIFKKDMCLKVVKMIETSKGLNWQWTLKNQVIRFYKAKVMKGFINLVNFFFKLWGCTNKRS